MNIFRLDDSPEIAASQMCDKHVVKMITESCQLLATCFTLDRLAADDCPRTMTGRARRHFNPKHPSSLWILESSANMHWLVQHTKALLQEKLIRYPSNPPHFCGAFLQWVEDNINDCIVPDGPSTKFKIAINQEQLCRQVEGFDSMSATDQYKLYYIHDKKRFAKWKVKTPEWFLNGIA